MMHGKKGRPTNSKNGNNSSVGRSKKNPSTLTMRDWFAARTKSSKSITHESTTHEQSNGVAYRVFATLVILLIILRRSEYKDVRSVRNTCRGIRYTVNDSKMLRRRLFIDPSFGNPNHEYEQEDLRILPLIGFDKFFSMGWEHIIYHFKFETIKKLFQEPEHPLADRFLLDPAHEQMMCRLNILSQPTMFRRHDLGMTTYRLLANNRVVRLSDLVKTIYKWVTEHHKRIPKNGYVRVQLVLCCSINCLLAPPPPSN